jgi:hypothetical protein
LEDPFDLAVEALARIDGMDFRPMILGEGHQDEHIGFGLIHERGKLRHLGTQLIGEASPRRAGPM